MRNIDLIAGYVGSLDMTMALHGDPMRRDAIERALERISEAATKLGQYAEKVAPGQRWPQIRAFGNVLRHQYDDVNADYLWRIIQNDLPSLRQACVSVLGTLDGE